jgi:choline dehydrogenase-like flavoprotein
MGKSPVNSVVDATGETQAVRKLYVADASLFPTASGVNPMITVAALAHHVARCIDRRLAQPTSA